MDLIVPWESEAKPSASIFQPAPFTRVPAWLYCFYDPDHPGFIQEPAWLGPDGSLAAWISPPRVPGWVEHSQVKIHTLRLLDAVKGWYWQMPPGELCSYFCFGAAYKKCPEFILMNGGPLSCCNSVISGTSINHPALVGRTRSEKYVKQLRIQRKKNRTEKRGYKREENVTETQGWNGT